MQYSYSCDISLVSQIQVYRTVSPSVIPRERSDRTPGWPLLPLRDNSPSGNPVVYGTCRKSTGLPRPDGARNDVEVCGWLAWLWGFLFSGQNGIINSQLQITNDKMLIALTQYHQQHTHGNDMSSWATGENRRFSEGVEGSSHRFDCSGSICAKITTR